MLGDKLVIAKICDADFHSDDIDGARVAWTIEDLINVYKVGVKPYEASAHEVWNEFVRG